MVRIGNLSSGGRMNLTGRPGGCQDQDAVLAGFRQIHVRNGPPNNSGQTHGSAPTGCRNDPKLRDRSGQGQLMALLHHLGSPLPAPLGCHQGETRLPVQVGGGVQALEGPQKDAAVAAIATEFQGPLQQRAAQARAPAVAGHDKPAQVRSLGLGLMAVDGDGPDDAAVRDGGPETVPLLIVAVHELGKLPGDLGLENGPNPQSSA